MRPNTVWAFDYSYGARVVRAWTDGVTIFSDCYSDEPLFTRDDYVGGDPEARAAWKAAGLD